MMKTIREHERFDVYCPYNDKIGGCVRCMALVPFGRNSSGQELFICGRLYSPEHFKQEILDGQD